MLLASGPVPKTPSDWGGPLSIATDETLCRLPGPCPVRSGCWPHSRHDYMLGRGFVGAEFLMHRQKGGDTPSLGPLASVAYRVLVLHDPNGQDTDPIQSRCMESSFAVSDRRVFQKSNILGEVDLPPLTRI